jgi:nucleotide-binding universal stress UspA family protein
MRVLPEHGPGSSVDAMEAARAALSLHADALTAAGLPVDVAVRRARPIHPDDVTRAVAELARNVYADEVARAIADLANEQRAEVIVLSTHGRSGLGRWAYGSVPHSVLQQSSTPVLLLPPHAERPLPAERPLRLLVALDGSELAEQAIQAAELLVGARGTELALLRVVDKSPYPLYGPGYAFLPWDEDEERASARQYLQTQVDRLQARGIRATTQVAIGSPARVIGQVAGDTEADIVVMATHGRSGLSRLVLGSVATSVLERAETPVLLVRPVAMRLADGSPSSAVQHLETGQLAGRSEPAMTR